MSQIGKHLGHPKSWVSKWIDRYQGLGVQGLIDLPRPGRPKYLTFEAERNFSARVQNGPLDSDDVTTFKAKHIRILLENEFATKFSRSGVYNLLDRLNFTKIKPRPKHEKNDETRMQQWKDEVLRKFYADVKKENPEKIIEVWFQDEMRFGNKTRMASQWLLRGSKPRQIKQQGYRNTYIYGAINPATGKRSALVFDRVSTDAMNVHLNQISQALEPGRHAIVIMDQAGWHSSAKDLKVPSNISILDLPPYSPELNPIERLWLYLKDEHLSNYVIKQDEKLIDLGCKIWNSLTDEVVKSVCRTSYLAFTN